MRQPENSSDVKLMDALAADSEGAADGGEGLGRAAIQAMVGNDDVLQAKRELSGQAVQGGIRLSPLKGLDLVTIHDQGNIRPVGMKETVLKGDGAPDGMGDGWNSVGAEGGAALGVVVAQGRPQADAPLVQGILEGKGTQPLAPDNPMDEPFVLGHLRLCDAVSFLTDNCGRLAHGGTSYVV
jgi:hypothetical protein